MIGNDVVDFSLANQSDHWKSASFRNKIFTPFEQQLIQDSEDEFVQIWKMWSQKEAAYKIVNRCTRIREFQPRAFECLSDEMVQNDDQLYKTTIDLQTKFVHSIAIKECISSELVRLDKAENLIYKDDLPYILQNDLLYYASKSHHGNREFVVYLNGFSSGSGTQSVSSGIVINS